MPWSMASPVHQNLAWPFSRFSCVCCMHPTTVAEPHLPSAQLCAMALFAYYGYSLVFVVSGQSGFFLDLIWSRKGIYQRCRITELEGTFPVSFPEKLLLVCKACTQSSYWFPAHFLGNNWNSVSSYLPLSPGKESLWSGIGPCQVCLHTTHNFEWAPGQGYIGVYCRGQVCRKMMPARFALIVVTGDLQPPKTPARLLGWRAPIHRRAWGLVSS